ncbi:hypothetical protein [Ekhidna sp. To15]|uniref:hypothetical protein n=1 Tax=Ekhidna sp. To15 TaxID=3395267 RepID=UPI003F520984
MKQLLSTFALLCVIICYGQESAKKASFLTKNQPIELFPDLKTSESISSSFQLQLPLEVDLNQAYQSDFMSFMSNDSRLLNYPSDDFSQANDVVFGNYMNTSLNLGNTTLKTIYIFDQTGRFVNSRTSFSLSKKKN